MEGEFKIYSSISFDYNNAMDFVDQSEIDVYIPAVKSAHDMIHQRSGQGSQYLGWVDLPIHYDREEYQRIKEIAYRIQRTSDVLIVIGIGGSYLGSKAVLDLLNHSFYNSLTKEKRNAPEIYFVGNSLSPVYLSHLIDIIDGKDLSINVISKSGNTIEPAIAFRYFRDYMEKKYGKEGASKRIFATTDIKNGALKKLATDEGYDTFVIPDDIGGRYSVLTAVGLLPIAVSGIDIDLLMAGAHHAREQYLQDSLEINHCYQYAVIRNILYNKGKTIELLVGYEPQIRFFAEWWKQLFGESEGKLGKGIFPAYVDFTTDLHSLGQYIQDGQRNLFETVITIDKPTIDIQVSQNDCDTDGLNYLVGKGMDFINKKACEGTIAAHIEGGVPNLQIFVPHLNAYHVGELIYFFEKACALSGYILGVNPFNQPGVEAYKKKMYALLGK